MSRNDPRREYLYVSKRLTRDIVEGATATTKNWSFGSASASSHGLARSERGLLIDEP